MQLHTHAEQTAETQENNYAEGGGGECIGKKKMGEGAIFS